MKYYITITCETPEAEKYVEEWLDDGFKNLKEASGNIEGLSVNDMTVGTYQETDAEIPEKFLPPGITKDQMEERIHQAFLKATDMTPEQWDEYIKHLREDES